MSAVAAVWVTTDWTQNEVSHALRELSKTVAWSAGRVVSLMMLPTSDTVQAVRICTESYTDALPAVPMHEAT